MIDYHPLSETAHGDEIWPLYRRMRDEAPVYYLEEFDCFFLTRFRDIWELLPHPGISVANGQTTIDLLLGQVASRGKGEALASSDPPYQTALRKAIMKRFSPTSARGLEGRTRELVRGFVDDVRERGRLDAIGDLAMRLSVRIACTIIGIPLEESDRLADDVNTFFERDAASEGTTAAGQDASARLFEYVESLVAERISSPDDGDGDLVDALLQVEIDGRKLSQEALLGTLQLAVVGGTETLPKVFAACAYRLWQHPEQRARVAADPAGLAQDAFWETLRYDMPTQMLGRTVTRELEVNGTRVRPGQKLMFLWPSANRDEREFADPDRFDVERRAPRILSFGHATHRCLGAHVAQMEGRILLEELLALDPEYEVVEDEIVRIRSEFFRGFSAMPIRFSPRN
ncbi:MAG: cytochrome P450 [Proteobacteria bacterium]|nr:cytochrome P450 [Pseudomonadota bacterium]